MVCRQTSDLAPSRPVAVWLEFPWVPLKIRVTSPSERVRTKCCDTSWVLAVLSSGVDWVKRPSSCCCFCSLRLSVLGADLAGSVLSAVLATNFFGELWGDFLKIRWFPVLFAELFTKTVSRFLMALSDIAWNYFLLGMLSWIRNFFVPHHQTTLKYCLLFISRNKIVAKKGVVLGVGFCFVFNDLLFAKFVFCLIFN